MLLFVVALACTAVSFQSAGMRLAYSRQSQSVSWLVQDKSRLVRGFTRHKQLHKALLIANLLKIYFCSYNKFSYFMLVTDYNFYFRAY